eukprot:TRINITY_DN49048_c0_g1_i1.p1 TRINITY_DN49048_c0_g1~~TRINITY_DN49048_c0_g1_i1.p1  ORF type:complete len:311 (-),score=57.75 TRINITY_DN49048_c0_g1_i1:58-990(-)
MTQLEESDVSSNAHAADAVDRVGAETTTQEPTLMTMASASTSASTCPAASSREAKPQRPMVLGPLHRAGDAPLPPAISAAVAGRATNACAASGRHGIAGARGHPRHVLLRLQQAAPCALKVEGARFRCSMGPCAVPGVNAGPLLDGATAALAHLAALHRDFMRRHIPEIDELARRPELSAAIVAASTGAASVDVTVAASKLVEDSQESLDARTAIPSTATFAESASAAAPSPPPRSELLGGIDALLDHVRSRLGDEASDEGIAAVRAAAANDVGLARRILALALELGPLTAQSVAVAVRAERLQAAGAAV